MVIDLYVSLHVLHSSRFFNFARKFQTGHFIFKSSFCNCAVNQFVNMFYLFHSSS